MINNNEETSKTPATPEEPGDISLHVQWDGESQLESPESVQE